MNNAKNDAGSKIGRMSRAEKDALITGPECHTLDKRPWQNEAKKAFTYIFTSIARVCHKSDSYALHSCGSTLGILRLLQTLTLRRSQP